MKKKKKDIAHLRQGHRGTLEQVYDEAITSRKCWHDKLCVFVHFLSDTHTGWATHLLSHYEGDFLFFIFSTDQVSSLEFS